ncbi:acid phosphatase PHO3 [Sugiyamaella lignohabitans]|uniref:Acid phosphatase PHO3 n=1 Tax=Sugiyamaella lignohabitans TaxID=796027 RepID=A0A161HIU1_9ASCO|nr:acid phosphatase PHO3 [Sugiyamaella lignohabitans]ANB12507.1 acid phosphatase PHO3 [Sugiyamaella lignohabitans]
MVKSTIVAAGLLAGASVANAQLGPPSAQKQFSQEFQDGNSVLKHFGGWGPYSDRTSYGIDRNTPSNCEVDQVFMLMRHGERYPDAYMGGPMVETYQKIKSNVKNFVGSLSFLNTWQTTLDDPNMWSQETYSGPYSGLATGYRVGVEYRDRYGHLWHGNQVPIFTSGYERVINTARRFGEGFFGYNYTDAAFLNIIPEDATEGANSLTPTCFAPVNSVPNYEIVSEAELAPFPAFQAAADRLNAENPGLNVNLTDVYNLMLHAPFELNARSSSPWVDVFTLDEWQSFKYMQSLMYYYLAGPGLNSTVPAGAVFANATLTAMNQGPDQAGTMFWNFAHDGNITPVLAALGLLVPPSDLPTDRIVHDTVYSMSDIVPMGAHLVLERMTCTAPTGASNSTNSTGSFNSTDSSSDNEDVFVRVLLNEAVLPFEDCQNGPGYSCPLTNYTAKLQSTLVDYAKVCQVPKEYPQYLSFFWDYNQTNSLNYLQGEIASQLTDTTWDDKPAA